MNCIKLIVIVVSFLFEKFVVVKMFVVLNFIMLILESIWNVINLILIVRGLVIFGDNNFFR